MKLLAISLASPLATKIVFADALFSAFRTVMRDEFKGVSVECGFRVEHTTELARYIVKKTRVGYKVSVYDADCKCVANARFDQFDL